jgi:hypothetical protein
MKGFLFFAIAFLICSFTFVGKSPDESISPASVDTDIIMDSMGNKIYLAYADGKPAYYYSNIFTPVCNTGECLPVYVNIYWNLAGRYLKFDRPPGQILTKLDHVPFTDEDYLLLDEILRGPDPRFDDMVKHSSPNPGSQGDEARRENNSEASPAPEINTKKFVTKYEMVDGITGATAIQHRAKFVPGALYTTYTIWGLANDCQSKMMEYTRKNLFNHKNYNYLITDYNQGCQQMVIEHLYTGKTETNARPNILMSVFDTANPEVSSVLINYIWYNDYELDTVINTMERKFYSCGSVMLQSRILYTWTYTAMANSSMVKLAENMHRFPEVFESIITLYTYKPYWPEGVLDGLLVQVSRHTGDKRKQMLAMLDGKKATFTESDWKKIKDSRP